MKKKKWLLSILFCFGLLKACGFSNEELVEDTLAPTITSTCNMYSISLEDDITAYSSYFSANDDTDGDLTEDIIIDDSQVVYGEPGIYDIVVSVKDLSGNENSQTFKVSIADMVAPVISLSKTVFSVTEGDSAPDYLNIATASDNMDGELTRSVVVDDSNVNYDEPGTYPVVFKVSDSTGNETYETASITVSEKVQERASTQTETSNNDVIVLITKTGECYHRKECGRGNYFEATLETALNRGLRACEKCW